MNKWIKLLVGFIISGICLYLTFKNFNFKDLSDAFKNAKWIWLVPSVFVHLSAYIVRSFRWQILISPLKKVKFQTVFIVLTFGFFINNILPFRLGELARAYALNKSSGISTSSSLGSIAIERMMDLVGLLFMIVVATQVISSDKIPITNILSMFIALGVIVIIAFIFFEKYGEKTIHKVPEILKKPIKVVNDIVKGFSSIKSKKKISAGLFLSLIVWCLELFHIIIISRVFDLNLIFKEAAVVIVGISVGVMIPAAPGFVGTYEFFGTRALTEFMSFPVAASTSLILVLHFLQIVYNSAMGLPGLLKFGIQVKKPVKPE